MTTETYAVLPFTQRMEVAAVVGHKTATSRTKRYGKAGDVVITRRGQFLRLTSVEKVRLDAVRDHYWSDEGCSSPEDFERVWCEIHPRKGFDPAQKVWLHRFERVVRMPSVHPRSHADTDD